MKNIILALILLASPMIGLAQKNDTLSVKSNTTIGSETKLKTTYTVNEIIEMLNKPLYSITDKGKKYQVSLFYFSYIERGLFYDEQGKPFIGTDNYGIDSEKGKVPLEWQNILKDRLKSGDTLKFSNIIVYPNPKEDKYFYSKEITLIAE